MTARQVFLLFSVLLLFSWFGLSLRKAIEKIETFPTHNGYTNPAAGFIHFSIGSLEQIDRNLLDESNVLLYDYGGTLGRQHNPLFIADFVLSLVPLAENPQAMSLVSANLAYLRASAIATAQHNLLFPYDFDFESVGETAPWYSAMAQARVAQAMMWGYRLTGEEDYLRTAKRAVLAIGEQQQPQQLARRLTQGVWLKEFPRYRYHVLDGSLVAIVGIREVFKGLPGGDPDAERISSLFTAAMTGFKSNYRCFTSPAGGVYFADNFRFANQSYYDIIMTHLAYLAELDPKISEITAQYSFEDMSIIQKLTLYYWSRSARSLNRWGLLESCVS